jgi:hypothetical protein
MVAQSWYVKKSIKISYVKKPEEKPRSKPADAKARTISAGTIEQSRAKKTN